MLLGLGLGVPFLTSKGVVVFDSFNRADNAASMGNADTGQAWQALTGTWGIIGNRAYMSTTGGGNKSVAVIDSGASDASIQVTFSVWGSGNSRLEFRVTDPDNCFLVQPQSGTPGVYVLYRKQAGAFTSLGSFSIAPVDGDVIKVVCVGPSIKLFVNGVQQISVSDSFNQSATKHGIGSDVSTTVRFDDFIVEAI